MKIAYLASSLLFVAAACGGKSKPAGPGPDNGGGATGPVYLSMFEMGASWTFDVHSEDSGEGETNTSDVKASCSVTKVSELQGTKLAEVTCDDTWPSSGMNPIAGTWAATDRGVWHLDGLIDDNPEPDLGEAGMLMAATPVAKTDHDEDPEMEGFFTETTVEQKGDAWCWSEMSAGGDEGWISLCIGPDGPTEGTFGWAGGSVHENTFTRAK